MRSRLPVQKDRIRKITGSFSWIDHRILSDGFLYAMARQEILLYFFLVLVGDKNGVSFYSYDTICSMLKINPDEFIRARDQLIERSLIDYRQGLFQVLQLPEKSLKIKYRQKTGDLLSLKELFNLC